MGLFERMKQAIGATKNNLVARIEKVLERQPVVDENLFEELEAALLGADVGSRVTADIVQSLRDQHSYGQVKTPDDVRREIRRLLLALLERTAPPAARASAGEEVWMIVGVNGTGKTTSVGKLAARLAADGRKVLICAADTFRAAAIEQLAVWA